MAFVEQSELKNSARVRMQVARSAGYFDHTRPLDGKAGFDHRVGLGVAEEQVLAFAFQYVLHAAHQRGEERVADARHHHANGVRAAVPQRPGDRAHLIAELRRHPPDPATDLGAHRPTTGQRATRSPWTLRHGPPLRRWSPDAIGVATDGVLARQGELLDHLDSWAAIDRWLDLLAQDQIGKQARGGCPIGSLVGQLAEIDPDARAEIAAGFDRWEAPLRDGLTRMRARGKPRKDANPAELATATMASIQGGLLLTQVRRDPGQLRTALNAARNNLRHAAP